MNTRHRDGSPIFQLQKPLTVGILVTPHASNPLFYVWIVRVLQALAKEETVELTQLATQPVLPTAVPLKDTNEQLASFSSIF